MQTKHELSVEGETLWRELKIYLEWSESFELIFLFTDNTIVSQLIQKQVKALYVDNDVPVHYFEPTESQSLIVDCLSFIQALSDTSDTNQRSPIWLEINQYGEQWAAEQTNLIQRINERRDGLRTRNPQPFVVVLPAAFSQMVYKLAPDLWSVRTFSQTLDQTFLVSVEQVSGEIPLPDRVEDKPDNDKTEDIRLHPAMVEWQRLVDKSAEGIDVFYAGYNAFDAAFDTGYYSEAQQVSEQLLVKANELNRTSADNPQTLRTLYVAFHCKGQINEAYGRLSEAENAYTESLKITQQIQHLSADKAEALRDISVSLEKLGNIKTQSGNLTEALSLFSESLVLRRQCQQLLGDQPDVLRDISVSLNKLGNIYQQQGDLTQALGLFSESLALRRQLQQLLGEQPEVLRDISIALNKLGDIHRELGNLNQALALFSESLTLFRQLQQLSGSQPKVLQDLCLSQMKLGEIYQLQNNKDKAIDYYNSSLAILEKLKNIHPGAAYIEKWVGWIEGKVQ